MIIDQSMQQLYQEIGGVVIGRSYWFNSQASWPFGGIEIYYDKIVLRMLWFRTEIKSYDIISIEKYGRFKNGLRIIHKNASISPYITYSSFHQKRLVQKLIEAGYKIK